MKSRGTTRLLLIGMTILAPGFLVPMAWGASGTWTQTASGGLWSGSGNWTSSTIADGSGNNANFNTIDIGTDPFVVHLDSVRTIGSLTFGDTDIVTTPAGWLLDNNETGANILTFATSPTITVNALGTGKSATISATIAGTGGLTKSGAGTLTLSGGNTYSGTTTIGGGILAVSGGSALSDSSAVTINDVSGATLTLNANETIGSIGTQNSGQLNGSVDVGIYTLTLAAQNGTGGGITTQLRRLTGSGGIIMNGTGSLNLLGFNSGFTGTLTINSGATALSDPSAGNNQMKVVLTGSGSLRLTSPGIDDTSVTIGELSSASASATISGQYGNGGGTKTLIVNQATSTTFAGSIADGTLGRLIAFTKSGAGTLTLSGNNTYTGGTTVSGGCLLTTQPSALSSYTSAGKVVFNGGTVGVRLGGSGWTTTQVDTLLANATKTSGTLGIDTTNGDLTQWAAFTTSNFGSALGVTKLGPGTLTLSMANTYNGATVVGAGKLSFGNGAGLGASAVQVTNGATLAVAQNANATANTMSGSLTMASGACLTMEDGYTSTLNIGGAATFGGGAGSTMTNEIGSAAAAADTLAITGVASISASGATITIKPLAGAMSLDTGTDYTLITAGAGSSLDVNALTLANTTVTVNGTDYNLSLVTTATSVKLRVTASGSITQAYWAGAAGSAWNAGLGNWKTSLSGNVTVGAQPNANTDVHFTTTVPTAINLNNTLGADYTVNTLNFEAGSDAVTIGAGNTLSIKANSVDNVGLVVASGSAAQTVNAAVALGAFQTWSNASANALTLGGNVANGGLALTIAGAGNMAISGTLSGGGTLTKTDSGTLTLTGPNNYGGLTAVSGGVLSLSNATALGTTVNGTTVADGAALEVQGGVTVGAEALTLNGAGISSGGALRSISGANVWQGTVTLGGATRVNSDAGTLTFNTAANSITGAHDLTLGGSGSGTVSGTITTGTGTLTKDGAGTWTLSGANNYSGAVAVNAGALNIRNATALGTTAGGVTVASGAALEIQNGITVGTESLTLNGMGISNGGALRNISGANVWQGTVTLGSPTRVNSDAGTLTFNTAANSITGAHDLTLGGSGSGTVSGTITTGTGTLTKDGAGTWTLTGANNYNGAVAVNAGALNIRNATALGTTAGGVTVASGAALEMQGGITVGTEALQITGTGISSAGALNNISGNNTWNGDIHVVATGGATASMGMAAGQLTIGGTVNVDGGVTTLNLVNPAVALATMIFNGGLNAGSITLNLSHQNSTYQFNGVGNYSGTTRLGPGSSNKLQIGNDSAFGTSALKISVDNAAGTTLEAVNGNRSLANAIALDATYGSMRIALTGANNLTFNGALDPLFQNMVFGADGSGVLTFAGDLTGSMSGTTFAKVGTGKVAITSGNFNYVGKTYVANGTLEFNSIKNVNVVSSLGKQTTAASATINLGGLTTAATLRYVGNGDSSDRVITLSGNSGGILENAGSGGLTLSGGITAYPGQNKTLTLQGSADGTISGSVLDPGTQTATLSGAVLSGASSFVVNTPMNNRDTTAYSPVFTVGATVSGTGIAPGTTVTGIANLANSSTATITISQPTTGAISSGTTLSFSGGATALTKSGTGIWTLSGANTYSGVTIVSNGVLAINGSLSAASTNVDVLSGGTLGGTGTINRAVTVSAGGAVMPGAGVMTVVSNFTFSADALYRCSATSSVISVGGTLSLPASATVDVSFAQGPILFQAAGLTGANDLSNWIVVSNGAPQIGVVVLLPGNNTVTLYTLPSGSVYKIR